MEKFPYFALPLLVACNSFALKAQNDTLATRRVELEPVIVTAQQREQQMLDVPATISTVSSRLL
ncbi:MAG: hypothetical protein LBJ57_01205, partial [Prevotellaceae bacterium]|nr:hypothetical protein [Prevotellaceae bacterium]